MHCACQLLFYNTKIGPAGSRAMGKGILGPGPVLDERAFPVPIPIVCTSCRTNIHVVYNNLLPWQWLPQEYSPEKKYLQKLYKKELLR